MLNAKVATKKGCGAPCTVTGSTPLPLGRVTAWSVKVLKTRNKGEGIYIGVAPMRIDTSENENHKRCGWYLCCYDSSLWSGPPHKYCGERHETPEGKRSEGCVCAGDSVGVVMDTAKGELSYVLASECLGAGYEGIPLDSPLVPCVIISFEGDSVKLSMAMLGDEVITF